MNRCFHLLVLTMVICAGLTPAKISHIALTLPAVAPVPPSIPALLSSSLTHTASISRWARRDVRQEATVRRCCRVKSCPTAGDTEDQGSTARCQSKNLQMGFEWAGQQKCVQCASGWNYRFIRCKNVLNRENNNNKYTWMGCCWKLEDSGKWCLMNCWDCKHRYLMY